MLKAMRQRRGIELPGSRWNRRHLGILAGRFCQAADLILLGGALLGIAILPYFAHERGSLSDFLQVRISLRNVLVAAMCMSTWRMILMSVGVYSPMRTRSLTDYLFRCVIGLNSCTAVVGLIEVILRPARDAWHTVEVFWLVALAMTGGLRGLLLLFDRLLRPVFRRRRNLIIVGSGERARRVFEEFKLHKEWDYRLVGFVDSEPQGGFVPAELILGGIDELEHILMHTVVDEVVIALPIKSQYEAVDSAITICQMLGIQAQYFTDHFGTSVTKRRKYSSQDGGRVVLEAVTHDYRLHVKRVLDLVLSIFGVIVLSPLFLGTALAIKLTSPGPILFAQMRYGLNKRTFRMLKFRSTRIDDESRLTPIGAFIRRMSIDDLPQLFNVLVGDMSLVGPRPLSSRNVQNFSDAWLMRRFSVKPGVSCLWQIMGISNTDFERWIALDLQYIDNWSLSLDLIILAKTIPAVLMSRGAT
jgi:exopolysaccharide biosynthesis polyprenyl glycosylphosphotransferase